jgi:AraC-like DNA-binding protein
MSAARRRETCSRHHDLVRRAKPILEDQKGGLPVVEDLAASLGLSPSRFQHLFRLTGHVPPDPDQFCAT